MKVNIDQTIEVSDEQRVQIANVLDGKVSKRQATRAEMKEFIWVHGQGWGVDLADLLLELTGEPVSHDAAADANPEVGAEDEDLLGEPPTLDDLL